MQAMLFILQSLAASACSLLKCNGGAADIGWRLWILKGAPVGSIGLRNPDLSRPFEPDVTIRGPSWPEIGLISRSLFRDPRNPDDDLGGGQRPPLVDPAIERNGSGRGNDRKGLTVAVALLALGGFAGIVGYAYTVGQSEQAAGLIPVVTPADGPIKQKPSEPGGLEVPHTDKGVLNNGEASTEDGLVAERLLPEPEAPLLPPQNQTAVAAANGEEDAAPSPTSLLKGLPNPRLSDEGLTEEQLAQRVEDLTRRINNCSKARRPNRGRRPSAGLPAPTQEVEAIAPPPPPVASTPRTSANT